MDKRIIRRADERVGRDMILGKEVNLSQRAVVYSPDKLTIGDHSRIDDFCILSCSGGLTIGKYCHVACYTALFAAAGIILEDFAGLSGHCVVYSKSDDYSGETMSNPTVPEKYKAVKSGLVVLRKHVLVGHGVTIMPGVTIGEGTAIGAKSFVNKDCEPWSIYAGIPAKRVGERSKNLLVLEKDLLHGAGYL